MSERLQLKKEEEPAHESMSCPACGKPMAVGAVICVQCGYDLRTKRRVGSAAGRKPSPIVVLGLLLVVLAAGAVAYLRSLDDGVQPTPVPPPPVMNPAGPETPAEAAPAAEATPAEGEAAPASAQTPADVPAAAPAEGGAGEAETPASPAEPEIDWAEVAARQRERIHAEVDRRTPMFDPGDAVELRLGNGLIRRGVFQGVDGAALRLETEADTIDTIAFETLDRNTRLRVDAAYRERYIEFLTRQRIGEMQRARAQAP